MPVSIFFLVLEYRRKGKSNGVQLTWNFMELIFGPEEAHWVSEMDQESPGHPLPRGQPRDPPTYFFLLYISIYLKTFGEQNRSGVPPPEASVATKNQSRPVPAPCRRGESLSGGHLHHPGALHDEEGVVLPRGWGYVPVAMCLISLSLSFVFLIWHDLDVSWALLL